MVDQSLVTSGFDVEVLLSERYLRYAILAQIEAGRMSLVFPVLDDEANLDLLITLHPPTDYQRRYEPEPEAPLPDPVPDSFATFLLIDVPDDANLAITVAADILDNATGVERNGELELVLRVSIAADEDDRGFETNHGLQIALVRLLFAGVDVGEEITEKVRAKIDRTIPFGVANNQAVQRVVTRIHRLQPNGRPRAFGLYLNLALRDGPEPDALRADRGDVDSAQNFLDAGRDVAFATGAHLFGMLGDDALFRMAEEFPAGSGTFRYPIRKDPADVDSETIGRVRSIVVAAERMPTGMTGPRLLIEIHAEYDIKFLPAQLPDPAFHLRLFLTPIVEQGLLRWEPHVEVDVDNFLLVPAFVLAVLGSIFLSPVVGVALFAIVLAADLVVDAAAGAIAADRAGALADAAFIETLPTRLAVAERRWDPLYVTRHQVVALIEGEVTVNALGLAFHGDAVLDREPFALTKTVIRDKDRDDAGQIVRLLYRVADLPDIAEDLSALAPGTDRRAFAEADDAAENLVALTMEQVEDRIATRRLFYPVLYVPRKVHIVGNQIRHLLLVTPREEREARRRLIRAARTAADAEVRANQGEAFRTEEIDRLQQDLGRDPTEEEIAAALEERIAPFLDDAQATYEAGPLRADLRLEINRQLRFDAAPSELAHLQLKGVLVVGGKEIRMRYGTMYYRDRQDDIPWDNLLELVRYSPPYVPPR